MFGTNLSRFFRANKKKPIRNAKKIEKNPHLNVELLEDRVVPTTISQWAFTSVVAAPDNSPAATTDVTGGTAQLTTLGMTNSYNGGNTANDDIENPGDTNVPAELGLRVRGTPHNGWATNAAGAAEYTQGIQLDTSTANYTNIQFSFDWSSTAQGIRDLQVQYNLNATGAAGGGTNAWLYVPGSGTTAVVNSSIGGTYIASPNEWYATTTPDITVSLPASASNDPNLGVRLVAAFDSTQNVVNDYAGATLTSGHTTIYNNSSGNWQFNNMTFSGTLQNATPTTAAVPTFTPSSAAYGASVSFTDVVTANNGITAPTAGSVTFMNGTTVLATTTAAPSTSGTSSTFTVSSSTIPVGAYSNITAVYNPGTGFGGSTSSASPNTLTITGTNTTTAAPTFTPTTVTVGSAVSFSAVVTASSGSTAPSAGSVVFENGTTVLATATSIASSTGLASTFTVSSNSVPVGSYSTITAVYMPGPGFNTSTSAASATTLTVNAVTVPIGTLAQWTFENDPIAVNNSPAPSTGVGTAGAIGMTNAYNSTTSTNTDDVEQGASSDTGANNLADVSQIWRVRGQTPGNGWSSQAPIGTQGAQFFTSTVGKAGPINISFDWYATTQGEANLQLEYTTNGGTTWTTIPITVPTADTDVTAMTNSNPADTNTVEGSYVQITGQNWAPNLTATITDPAAANDAGFGIEMVNASTGADDISAAGTPLNNTSGNWRFDNVDIAAPQAYTPGNLVVLQAGNGTTSYNAQAPLYLNEISTSLASTGLIGINGTTADSLGNVTVTVPNYLVTDAVDSTYGTPGGTATLTTNVANTFAVGDKVTITNMGDPGYDGTFTITAANDTTGVFSFVDNNAPTTADDSGGTATNLNFSAGEDVQISGVQVGTSINSGYNGVYAVSGVTYNAFQTSQTDTFTYFDQLAAGLAAGTPAPTVASAATGGAYAYALVQQDAIPSVAGSGAQAGNQPITLDLSAAAGNGQLNRSYDGSVLTFDGIDSTINNGGLTSPATPTGQDNRVIAVIGGNPGVALSSSTSNTANSNPTATPFYNSTTQGAFYVGDDNRASVAEGPVGPIFTAGHPNQAGGAVSQGVHEFATEGPSIGTQVSASTNIRGITIGFDNREYFSTASGLGGATALNSAGIFTDPQALPTTANTTNDIMVVPALFGASKLGGVYLADVNGTGVLSNGDELFFVDDGTVGHAGTGGLYVSTWNTANTNNPWNTPNNTAAAAAGFLDYWSVPVRIGDAPIQNGSGGVGQMRGLTGTVIYGSGTTPTVVDLYTTAYDNVATNTSSDNSIIQQWLDPNAGAAITNATQNGSGLVTLTFNVNIPASWNGQTVEIDGVTSPAGTQGAAALSQGYNGAFVVSTVAGHANELTYQDTNAGASSLATITNAGAADIVLTGTIIAEANAGTDVISGSDSGDIGLRGVAFAPVAATSVLLSQSPANPLTPGTGVTLTAAVSNPEAGVNVNGDVVTFINENTGAILGQANVGASIAGEAILTLPSGVVGNEYVQAYFAGGGVQALASARSNTIQIVEDGPIDTWVQETTSCPVGAGVGSPVTFTATVNTKYNGTGPENGAFGASDTVSFYNGSVSTTNLLGTVPLVTGTYVTGTDAQGTATLVSAFSAIGTDTIIAVFNGDNNYESSQASLTQNIGANATGTISSSANSVALGATPTYTATVAGNSTVGAPSGSVTFTLVSATTGAVVGTSSATTLTISGNSGTATWTSPALSSPGSYFVTFTYTPGTGIQYNGFTIDTISSTNGTAFVETVKQAFTPGNLVAVQRGDGNINLGSSGYLVFLDEYTTSGNLVQRIALPNLDAGTTHALLLSGQNSGEGLLNRSANGAYLTVAGYDVPVGRTFLTSTFPYQYPRTIALVDGTGTVNTTTTLGIANPSGSGLAASIKSATAPATGTGQTVTITLNSANDFLAGQTVTIAGITDGASGTAYDGTFTVASSTTTSFTYVDTNNITSTTPTYSSPTASSPASVPYNPTDVVSEDGSQFYVGTNLPVGDTIDGGILYVGTVGASGVSASEIGPVGTSSASIGIDGGQLYSTTGSGKLTAVGTGLPTTIGQTLTGLPSFQNNYDLFYHNSENAEEIMLLNTTNGSTINPNVAYVADQANGLLKFTLFSASSISLSYSSATRVVTGAIPSGDGTLVNGQFVAIANASDPTFDGTFKVTVSGNTFTYTPTTAPSTTSATGATGTEWVYGDSSGNGTFGQKLIFAGGATAVTGYVVNPGPTAQVQLYLTGSNVQQANANQLDSWLDTNGGTAGLTSGNVTTMAFVGATGTGGPPASPNGNENFAGLAFAPGYATVTSVAVSGTSGAGYTVTATVTDPTGGSNVPTGAVYFYLDGSSTPYGSAMLNGSGVATLTIPTGSGLTGEHSFTAAYQGDVKDDASSGVSGQAFGAGNLIATVTTVGASTSTTTAPTSVSEFQTTGGAAVQTIYMPTSGQGELTLKGNTTTEGYVSDSADGQSASFAGYLVDAGYSTSGANAAIAVLQANGSVSTTTQIASSDIGSSSTNGSVKAAISADGLGFWVASGNDLRYVPFGNSTSTPSVAVSTFYSSPTTVEIGSGTITGNPQLPGTGAASSLYITGAAGTPGGGLSSIDGPAEVFGGLTTVAGQSEATLGNGGGTDFNTSKDTSGNFPATNQIAISPDGLNIFVADSRTDGSGGILWYFDNSGIWDLVGSAQVTGGTTADSGLNGLVADFSQVVNGNGPVTLYGTTTAASGNRIVQITGFTLSSFGPNYTAPTFTTVETAAAGTEFNGVAFAPKAAAAATTSTAVTVTSTGGGHYADASNNVTLSATVTDTSGGTGDPTPAGYVSFRTAAGVEIGSAPLVNGTATLAPVSDLLVAQSGGIITAVYTGNSFYAGSSGTSGAQTTTVVAEGTTTTLTDQYTNVATGVTDNLSAQVTFTGSYAQPTGTVTFWQDAIGTGTNLGTATLTPTVVNGVLEFLATGVSVKFTTSTGSPHPMYAVYNGDSTVNLTGGITGASPTVTGLSSTSSLAVGMVVTGTYIPAGTTIKTIVNSTSITLSSNAGGTNAAEALTFTAGDGQGDFAASTSPSNPITVVLAPTITVTNNNSTPDPLNSGVSVQEKVTVTGTGATPTGYVQFYDDLVPIGSPTQLSSGSATITLTTSPTQGTDTNGNQFLLPGIQSITAVYSGNATYFSGSGVYQQLVQTSAFGAGDKFVYRVGDGINSLDAPTGSTVVGAIGSTIYVDEINTSSGNVVQSIIMPTADGTGTQASIHAIVGNGQQSSTEQLTVDGANSAIWLTGYDTNPLQGVTVSTSGVVSGQGTTAPGIETATGSTSITRAIARITTAGAVGDETFTATNSGSGFGNFNAVYSPDGTSFYLTGDGKVTYFASFSPASGTVTPTATVSSSSVTGTALALEAEGGNLVTVSQPGFGNDGPQVYSGFPTTTQTPSNLPGFSDAAATAGGQASTFFVDAYFTHLDNTAGPGGASTAPAGINTMYLSDDGPSFADGAITKWSLVNGTWVVTDHITANGSTPITYYYISGQTLSEGAGSSAVGNVTLYVTYGQGGNADNGEGQLVTITDNSGYDAVGLTAGTVINQTSSSSKEVYRGVATFGTTPLTGAATPITNAVEGTSGTFQVATFTDPYGTTSTAPYSATIKWGDGTTSAGVITYVNTDGSGAHFTISGTHTYAVATASAGYPVTVTFNDVSFPANVILNTTATVADATAPFNDITVTGVAPAGLMERSVSGQATFTASISGTTLTESPNTTTLVVGQTLSGTGITPGTIITAVGTSGHYTVSASQTVASESMTVAGVQVATFTDPIDFGGAPFAASQYTATIQWGDGTSSAGTIVLTNPTAVWPASGSYTVVGTHTYTEDTATGFAYPITVTVSFTGGTDDQNAVGTTSAVVGDCGGPNPITGSGSTLSETAGTPFGPVQVIQFTDPITYGETPIEPASTYTASINWGDSTAASTGTITFSSSNTTLGTAWYEIFNVAGSHTYASAGTYTIAVTISGGDSGFPVIIDGTATVTTPSAPNVTVTKVADSTSDTAYTQDGYTLTISNTGNAAAAGLNLTDTLPALGNGNVWTIDPSVGTPANFTISSGALSLSSAFVTGGDSLAASATISVHIVGTPTLLGTLTNTATVTETNETGSQSAMASITVTAAAPTSVKVNQYYAPITAVSLSGTTATFTTDGSNGYVANGTNTVTIQGYTAAGQSGYDGTWVIASVSGDQFTVTNAAFAGLSSFSGTGVGFALSTSQVASPGNTSLVGNQRSMVDCVTYNFSVPVSLTTAYFSTSSTIQPTTSDPGTAPALASALPNFVLTNLNGGLTWVVTWTTHTGNTVTGHSIADGVYDIVLANSNRTAVVNGNTVAGDVFFRDFGNFVGYSGGQAQVNLTSQNQFNNAYTSTGNGASTYRAAFDLTANDAVGVGLSITDQNQFNNRYGSTWTGFTPTI